MWSISIAIVERSSDIEVPDTVDEDPDPRDDENLIAPRALPNMRGTLRNEAKHHVRCHHIAIGWHLESGLMGSENESQSPATRTRNHPLVVRWGRYAKREEAKVGPGTEYARNAPVEYGPRNLPSE
jgi:hypothetical protein